LEWLTVWGDKTTITTLNFEKRDFLYDNGLVNIFLTILKDKSRFDMVSDYHVRYKNTDIKLTDLKLQISGDIKEIKEIYFILRSIYYSKVFEETNNFKPYYDSKNDTVVIGPVLSVKPFLERSERAKDLLPTTQLKYSKLKELQEIEEVMKKNFDGKVDKSILRGKKALNANFLPPEKLGKVNIYSKPEKLGDDVCENIKEILIGEKCVFCGLNYTKYKNSEGKTKSFVIASNNLVFDFGTGDSKPSFRDSRTKKDLTICFNCDIIYRYGLMKNYFVDNNVFLISGPSLKLVNSIKLRLPNLTDNYLDTKSKSKTNFLEKSDFITTDMNSHLLLLFYKIYMNFIRRDEICLFSVFYFIVKGTKIEELKLYNKMSYLTEFFEETNCITIAGKPFLYQLMKYAYYKDFRAPKTKNMPRKKIASEILDAKPINSSIFNLSYYNLSLEKSSWLDNHPKRGRPLFTFLEKYLEVTGMVDLKELHEICMIVGDRIGYFAENNNNKNLLYELREIGNLENLTEFFRDLEYAILKEKAGAIWNSKPEGKDETYSDFINKLLINVQSNKETALVRNYLGIYAVQKYMSTKYAKSQKGD
jgi:hypothetical protein